MLPLPIGYTFTGKPVAQALAVGTAASASLYGWEAWTVGRLVKFEATNPENILATYIPSFPIPDSNLVEAVDSIKLMTIAIQNDKLWVLGRILSGSGMKHMDRYSGILMVLDTDLPKQENGDEIDLLANPAFLPVEQTYLFSSSSGAGFGDQGYGEGAWGGSTPTSTMDHFTMDFTSPTTLQTNMINGYTGLIELKHNFFIHDTDSGSAILLRDARLDIDGGNIVAC